MRRQQEHREQGFFVAEGEKVVRRLIESRFSVVSALMPEKWFAELRPLLEARSENIKVFIAEKSLLETLTGFSMYQGLLAVGVVPALPSLEHVLRTSPAPVLLAAVESLSSAENMGALVRNCAGLGVGALIVGERCASPFLRRAVRSSMGTVFQVPIVESQDLVQALSHLRSAGIHCVAAHPHPPAGLISCTNLTGPACILFGSEGYGISAPALAACNEAAAIPMPSAVDSLNVGSAAAIFLYEAQRQRGKT